MPRDAAKHLRWDAILKIVAEKGTVRLVDLQKELADKQLAVSPPTLRNDLYALIDGGEALELRRGIITAKASAKTEYEKRSGEQKPEKQGVAVLACALLFPEDALRERVRDNLKDKLGWQSFPVIHLLEGIWQKTHRIVSMDAGSTTHAIAKQMGKRILSFDDCSQLTVVTNAPAVVEELYKTPKVQTIVAGGELRKERYSIVGHLAERCLDAFDIVTDMGFIGATGIDFQRGFTSDSVLETQVKVRLLDSRIRCVVLDHTKISRPGGTFSVFVGFSPQQLDFVLMDDEALRDDDLFRAFRKKLEDANICLLTPSMLGLGGKNANP